MAVASTSTSASSIISQIASRQTGQASGTSSSGTGSTILGSGTDSRTLNNNFDMFLKLLTTQLRNQSPLDPMKADQFAQQITQFSGIEQQIKMNSNLERLITAQSTGATSAALNFLGADVVASGSTATLGNGAATWTLNASGAGTATITIRNAAGTTVRTETRTIASGQASYSWNGRNDAGAAQADGNYTIAITAVDAGNRPVTVSTSARGRVTGVDLSGAEPMLTVGTARVKLSEVTSVGRSQ